MKIRHLILLIIVLLSSNAIGQVFATMELWQRKAGIMVYDNGKLIKQPLTISINPKHHSKLMIPIRPYIRVARATWNKKEYGFNYYADQLILGIGTGFELKEFTLVTGLNYNHFWDIDPGIGLDKFKSTSFDLGVIVPFPDSYRGFTTLFIIDLLNGFYYGSVTLGAAWRF